MRARVYIYIYIYIYMYVCTYVHISGNQNNRVVYYVTKLEKIYATNQRLAETSMS